MSGWDWSRLTGGVDTEELVGVLNQRMLPLSHEISRLGRFWRGDFVFDVRDFGARGDGLTDDTAAIQAAIDACLAAGGGIVFLPEGTYLTTIGTELEVYSGVHLVGAGLGVTIITRAASTSDDMIHLGNPGGAARTFVGLHSLTVDGNRSSTTLGSGGTLVLTDTATEVFFSDLEITGGPFIGFMARNVDQVFASRVYTHDHNKDGFSFFQNCTNINVDTITSRRCGDDGIAFNSYSTGNCEFITASNLVIEDGGRNDGTGNQAGACLGIRGGRHVVINGVVTRGGMRQGINMEDNDTVSTEDVVVTGWTSYQDGTDEAGNRCALYISDSANRIRVQGQIYEPRQDGVVIDGASRDIDLDLQVFGALNSGIKVSKSTAYTNVEIRGSVQECGESGLRLVSADHIRLIGVRSVNNNQDGNTLVSGLSCGATVDGCSNLQVIGGDYSDTQGSPTQEAGFRFHGTATTGLMMVGVRADGNISTGASQLTSNVNSPVTTLACEGITNGVEAVTLNDALEVLGGPNSLGTTALGRFRAHVGGTWTSDGSSNIASGVAVSQALTGHANDTSDLSQMRVFGSIVGADGVTVARVAGILLVPPTITVGGSGGAITTGATLYISNETSGPTNNYALFVDAGASRLDGSLLVGGDTELDGALNHDGSTVGFYGTAPTTIPNVPLTTPSVQDVIDALLALGLVEQSD